MRSAIVTDAAAIARVNAQSWREAYGHFLSAEFLDAMSEHELTARWVRIIELGYDVHLVAVGGLVTGFSHAYESREPDAPRPIVLGLIYQLATMHGSGSGQALLDGAVGDGPAYLWVAELNPRAIRFYERNGFVLDGTRKRAEQWENLVELRMVR